MAPSAWTPFHANLYQTLRDRKLLEPGQKILIAVSGGQDSLCLARLLLDLQPKWNWELAIAHCNHRWRSDADANAAFVQSLAQSWQLPYYQAVAEKAPMGEAAARDWRYQCLGEIAQQHHYDQVALGHTASDRAETLLHNLVRGSGADGLQALAWQRPLKNGIFLVRPLLTVTRGQTGQFCQEAGLTIWQDSTNQDLKYARNRIRLELIPYLQAQLNSQAELHLVQTAELLQADVEYLQTEASKIQQQVTQIQGSTLSVNRRLLQEFPLAMQRRVLRQILQTILPSAPNFDQIEKLVRFLAAPHHSQTDPFPGGAIAQVEKDWIWFKHPHQAKSAAD